MFSIEERYVILDDLIDMFKSREDISAAILVGSASYGFRDKYSDSKKGQSNGICS